RRPERQYSLLQPDRRGGDAGRPLLDDHSGDGDRRLARGKEVGAAVSRHIPDHRRSLRRSGGRRHRDHRRPDLLPRACAPPGCRASRDDVRHLVRSELSRSGTMETSNIRKRVPVSALFDPKIVLPAIGSAFVKLNPLSLMKNPVMFVLEVVTALTTVILIRDLVTGGENLAFEFQIVLWLWCTVLFASFAEAVAEGRGKAQAAALRRQRTETQAKLLMGPGGRGHKSIPSTSLKVGDVVLVEAGDTIPSDGEVIEGIASVNEAAITGESAPVIRESGGDRSAGTGGPPGRAGGIKGGISRR